MGMRSVSVGMLNQAVSSSPNESVMKTNSLFFRATQTSRSPRHFAVASYVQPLLQQTKPTDPPGLNISTLDLQPASSAVARECRTHTAASTSQQPARTSRARKSPRRPMSALVRRSRLFHRVHATFLKRSDTSRPLILC